jgi:hypothetical protein
MDPDVKDTTEDAASVMWKRKLEWKGHNAVVCINVPINVARRWQQMADAEGKTLDECLDGWTQDHDGNIGRIIDDILEPPCFPMDLDDIQWAQSLFCQALHGWSCPWDCDNKKQTREEFLASVREWAEGPGPDDELEHWMTAAEHALAHRATELRSCVKRMVDKWNSTLDSELGGNDG